MGREPAVEPAIRLDRIAHSYGAARVLDDISLSLPRGGVLALLGASGCGKSTLLNLIAGLLAPAGGRISIGGDVVADAASGRLVPPEKRDLGMVFQDYALWPHLSVGENVSFPLEMRRVPRATRRRLVDAALERVGLGGFAGRRPSTLSGGQQQRVAIARAIVAEPKLVLFDEPLSNLDRDLRDQLAGEIGTLIRGLGLSAVYVTHDHAEAFTLADRVAVMRGGRIDQIGAPDELINAPARPEVAEFLHLGTLVDAEWRDGAPAIRGTAVRLPLPPGDRPAGTGRMLLPLSALTIVDGDGVFRGRVAGSAFRGDRYLLTVQVGTLEIQVPSVRRATTGEAVGVDVDPARIWLFPEDPSQAHPEKVMIP